VRSEFAEFVTDEWEQLIGGLGIAALDVAEDAR